MGEGSGLDFCMIECQNQTHNRYSPLFAMTLRVAINGFGRIGRNFMRCWLSRGEDTGIEVVGLNDTSDPKTNAHLLQYDTMLGHIRNAEVSYTDETIVVNGRHVKCFSDRNPLNLPWNEWEVDLVIEATGVFIDQKGAGKHIEAGAKKVLITAPGKGEGVGTFVVGVNADQYRHEDFDIISNASCTTNCMAPLVKVLDQSFGIVKGTMTTTHSYTGDQRILDASHRDLRRARAAAVNIVPTSTGAAKAVALVYPPMKGKLNGIAMRVPTPNVSVVDLVLEVKSKHHQGRGECRFEGVVGKRHEGNHQIQRPSPGLHRPRRNRRIHHRGLRSHPGDG